MNLLGVSSNWQLIFTGLILLGATALDSVAIRWRNP
jgi:ribose/xylose/arabinose/galactoside ABC-type transport system permease subunit